METKTLNRQEIIERAYEIAEEYGGNLTVRQLYYQFVARGLLESGQKVYKRIVAAVSVARMEGRFPFEWIVDRTRTCHPSKAFRNQDDLDDALKEAKDGIQNFPYWYLGRDRWFGQPKYVTVGVEKEALAGVFEPTCNRLGVGLFVFRGYSSLSALHQLAENIAEADEAEEAVVLYFGDFDPDGWEIPRAAERAVNEIADVTGLYLPEVTFDRCALNMDQIRQHNPPPFGAKVSSTRFQSYWREHQTSNAWELDALPPNVLQDLIRESVALHFDESIHRSNRDHIKELQGEMRDKMKEEGWLDEALEDL